MEVICLLMKLFNAYSLKKKKGKGNLLDYGVIIKQLKEINGDKNRQKGKLDKKKLIIF
jgi:hypothetical protein